MLSLLFDCEFLGTDLGNQTKRSSQTGDSTGSRLQNPAYAYQPAPSKLLPDTKATTKVQRFVPMP
jgi:hypothetical protein